MTLRIFLTPKASQDLDDLFNYLVQNNDHVALKFFDATRKTIAKLAQFPNIGSVYLTKNARLQGLRKFRVENFKNYLIFYQTSEDILTVVPIVNAARDLPKLLELWD